MGARRHRQGRVGVLGTYPTPCRGIGSAPPIPGGKEAKMLGRVKSKFAALLISTGAVLGLIFAQAASAALPAGYDVQRVDSPVITNTGDFGIAMANIGDINGDGEQDIVIGSDEHLGGTAIFELSGADGSTIRSISAPDTDPTGSPSWGSYIGKLPDIGRCTSSPGPGNNCPAVDVTTTPDGAPEVLVSALQQDVGGVADIGR